MRREAVARTLIPLCGSLCLPPLSVPSMFGAFSFTALPRPALSHTEPGLAASTRQTLPTLCASISKTARSVSRGPGATSSRQRRLHTLDVPVATQPAIDANCDSAVSQQDTAVDNSHESKSSATAASTRPAKRTHRKAKEEQQDSPISTDLRCVKAVGPKNEALLLRNGLSSVDRLKEVYKVKHNSNTLALKTFLQEEVGIRKHHCTIIASDIKLKVDEETAEAGGASSSKPSRRVTLCMEGNISAGKSTFLRWVASGNPELEEILEVVPEPVDKWQDIGNGHHNVLQAFYDTPDRYAYTFQNYVFVTRMMQEKETQLGDRPFRLLERSVFSDRMVFVRTVHEKCWMSDLELNIYDSWFEPVVTASPSLIPDGFIYLRATPKICMNRMLKRQRSEESAITLDYLHGIHQKHEEWLFAKNGSLGALPQSADSSAALSASASHWKYQGQSLPEAMRDQMNSSKSGTLHLHAVQEPEAIRGKVLYLSSQSRPDMPKFIEGVPTLVLDYDKDIDMSKDIEAKHYYGKQVKAYFDFVKALRDKKAEDVRLSPFTGNLTEGVVEKATPDQVALMKKVMLQANEPGVSAEDRAFLKRMWDLTLRAERGSTLVAGAL